MQPLISIITVTYNAEKVLEPTLRSVAGQTFRDFEHIIVDGASSDATLALATSFQTPEMQIHSKPDKGIYHGMNRGLMYAKGKYVIFLNAGDRFANNETLRRYAEAATQAPDILYGDTMIVNEEGEILRPRHLQAPSILTHRSFLKGMLICHQAFMVRRDLAPEYSHTLRLSADYEWCLNCIARSKVTKRVNLNTVTIHYLDNGVSEKKKLASLKERFDVMRRHYGLGAALKAHIGFIPRVIKRKISRPHK